MDNLKKMLQCVKTITQHIIKKKNFLCKFGTKVSHYAKIKHLNFHSYGAVIIIRRETIPYFKKCEKVALFFFNCVHVTFEALSVSKSIKAFDPLNMRITSSKNGIKHPQKKNKYTRQLG